MNIFNRKILAVIIAFALSICVFTQETFAWNEDWKSILRDAFGLVDSASDMDDCAKDSEEKYGALITDPQEIIDYIAKYGVLPDNFITKNEAKVLGWDSRKNYVSDVAPGKSIGGDRFGNYESLLPDKKDRRWYECDANYQGGERGVQRVVFSSDGLYYYTDDHYESFTQMFPEEQR